jgi:hypothetical protein
MAKDAGEIMKKYFMIGVAREYKKDNYNVPVYWTTILGGYGIMKV